MMMRPSVLARVQFFTTPVISSEFGMITLARSKVSISVARTRMRRTQPSSPLTTMESPARIGRSASRIRPETKFDTIDCRPKPMPTESAPATSAIFCRSMPRLPSASAIAAITPT